MIVGLDPHDGIDDFLQTRRLHVRGTKGYPVSLAVELVWGEAGHKARLLIENATAVEHWAWQHGLHLLASRQWFGRNQDIQPAHFRPERLKRELVVRKGQRAERNRGIGQIPDLVIIVFCMCLPDEEQSLAVVGFLNPVAESFTQHNAVLRYAERRQAGLKLFPAQSALRRRVSHAEGFVMHVGGRPKPIGERHMRTIMQFLDQGIGSRLPRILTHALYPSIVDYKPGRLSAVTSNSIGLLARRP